MPFGVAATQTHGLHLNLLLVFHYFSSLKASTEVPLSKKQTFRVDVGPISPRERLLKAPHTHFLCASSLILLSRDILWFLSTAAHQYKPVSYGGLRQAAQRNSLLLIRCFISRMYTVSLPVRLNLKTDIRSKISVSVLVLQFKSRWVRTMGYISGAVTPTFCPGVHRCGNGYKSYKLIAYDFLHIPHIPLLHRSPLCWQLSRGGGG